MLIWIVHMDLLEKYKWTQIQYNAWLMSKWHVHMDFCPTRHSLNFDLDVHLAPDGYWILYGMVVREAAKIFLKTSNSSTWQTCAFYQNLG